MKSLLLLLLLVPQMIYAQGGGNRGGKNLPPQVREEIENIRKNVFTRVLVLTDVESQKFWPIFSQMQAELDAIKMETNKTRHSISDQYATMTDADMEKSISKLFDLEQKALTVKRKYTEAFKKVLPIKKVALIPRAEREFKKALLEKIRDYKLRDDEPDNYPRN